MRQVVSYEDITLPYEVTANAANEVTKLNTTYSNNNQKSQSKRKRKSRNSTNRSSNRQGVLPEENHETEDMDMSRELTYEEIWDDSALVDAWNAATEEYEAYHGPDKGWKSEPVHKSPLWYNVPPAKKVKLSDGQGSASNTGNSAKDGDADSRPIDFDTFIPDHDAGLSKQSGVHNLDDSTALPGPPEPMVSRDEAFNRALNAMYWSGYWTAVYHCHNHVGKPSSDGDIENRPDEEDHETEDDVGANDMDDFVPTQR
ncbi:hypothetical protein E1B28_009728 [Marasmius oreades]|uniref:Uncharacterized protein n=1 Tax=Marasmius oreades TaxID=181124 RepID=A0A9P7RVN0_9AGAR|nr:uncharacterized protein E1B28_009728 [Marasmius oreades]KAG7090626.1 hypothetical protein E1B28_009728 [Marasmius oreades]